MPNWPAKAIEYVIAHWPLIALGHALVPVTYIFIYSATLSRRLKKKYLTTKCVECAYDLSGKTSDRCPECGHSIPFKQKRHLKRISRRHETTHRNTYWDLRRDRWVLHRDRFIVRPSFRL